MSMLRVIEVDARKPFLLAMKLSDGSEIERDVADLLVGPIFDAVRNDAELFAAARADDGTVVWPNGADLCPDVLIWGGMPPADESSSPAAETS